ncbi:hypothetical protein K491DRAFT_605262 [Lophiostoma macrostomum CBS 122681]|uniref:INSIG domain-containing protein n=1 Tax=Lophiostoma macrostomum CBS 122681 TaxID=1314788 RepID=A0A6A6T0E1_9PLEO|nr:hypothetical protein K491DRAFT_605262 [Lophiostoma macrostomum CBS 122681]
MNADDPSASSQQQQQQTTTQQPPHIYRPIPRRNFPSNPNSSTPQSPDPLSQVEFPWLAPAPALQNGNSRSSEFLAQLNARLLRTNNTSNGNLYDPEAERGGDSDRIGRNKSFLNMTNSTLYGIYDEVGSNTTSVSDTPWGVGAETPARRSVDYGASAVNGVGSPDGGLAVKERARRGPIEGQHRSPRLKSGQSRQRRGAWKFTVIFGKLASLFLLGAVYGIIVSHLHDSRELAAVQVGGVNSKSWLYLAGWGLAGLVLGSLLPYVDLVSGSPQTDDIQSAAEEKEPDSSLGEQWNDVVRSVGAFIGIAFAIRRLPWQSTLQLTLTLALVNPALWYILDRSRNGLSFSLITTSILTSCIFLSNPDVLPSPALPATMNATHSSSSATSHRQDELFAGMVSYDNLATATWVGSVIFCSCICFGGIGRRLAVFDESGKVAKR